MVNEDARAEKEWSQREEEISRQNEEEQRRELLNAELYPKRRCLHKIFVFVSIVAGLTSFNMGLGQFVGMVYFKVDPIQYVLRVYIIALCALMVLTELEWTKMTRESRLLNNWVSRGCVYSFIGVLGLEENDVSPLDDTSELGREAALNYIKVVAWLMIGCGILYFCMGVLCLQLVCNRLRRNYQERQRLSKEKRRAGLGRQLAPGGEAV